MRTLEQLKKELKDLQDETLDELDQYIHRLRQREPNPTTLPTYHLLGRYDRESIRKLAYE